MEEFIADPARIGHRYLDHYAVWTTSGITGRQGIFVHDDGAQVMYTAMLIARTSRHMRFAPCSEMGAWQCWLFLAAILRSPP